MENLSGTKTEKNLIEAFAGESKARNRYTYFAAQAKKEGYVQICKIFKETAENEREHAKIWLKLLDGISTTKENLKESIKIEEYESTSMYPEFARIAKDEGFLKIAKLFEEISKVEASHAKRYRKLLENIEHNRVFISDEKIKWHCSNCGYILECKNAPEKCPLCEHKKEYFERFQENY